MSAPTPKGKSSTAKHASLQTPPPSASPSLKQTSRKRTYGQYADTTPTTPTTPTSTPYHGHPQAAPHAPFAVQAYLQPNTLMHCDTSLQNYVNPTNFAKPHQPYPDYLQPNYVKPEPSRKKPKGEGEEQEKRLRPWRTKASKAFLEKLHRAQTQRMVVIGRKRSGQGLDLKEEVDVVGTTGNIYTVTIGRCAECTCPDHRKGNQCKHKVYVMHTVLKARPELEYQCAFLSNELQEIFANAPALPSDKADSTEKDGKRKPIEGECPICYMDMEEDKHEIVWCKSSCGNNIHESCFNSWARSRQGDAVRCVYCRADWEMDKSDIENIKKAGEVNDEGYINVAGQFGLSGIRDTSTYYQPYRSWSGRSGYSFRSW